MFINPMNPMIFCFPYFYPIQLPQPFVKEEASDTEKEQTVQSIQEQTNASGIVRGKGQLWTNEEVNNLVKYYKQYHGDWKKIIKHLKGRNISQCSQKYRKLQDQEKRTKRKWSTEEDRILLDSFELYGRQWIKIAEKLPGRTSKQVRDRYVNQINPTINHNEWSETEDRIIMKEFQQNGPRWAQIAKQLNNRSENQVKNRFYYTILKKYNGELHPYLKIQH
ncbi:unnamed protein product (macronuclear) [Paramecium tetraurelia]|uniref:Myb-like DNA-binding domain containing protein n=1 Tax=Paramecium tetraurelia TaxID=5888 RepID=A0CGP3_PARTE|nr:uncharacterized protein GSPATT00007400001 [Paramecium tetraurelia]CAK69960.1 unnamed protein product [Paramecium tetraurelia]|eukprot:XP_001437357.1 hypothetical protein (macronuclear) [Paramecium tetraurelia strain d4-2]